MSSTETEGADMTAQVTALSTKLLEAIDRQADLEDQVQVMRKELDHSRRENMRYEDRMKSGDLVNKSDVALEKAKRVQAEQEAARLQGEIEELTSSLFDEANKMVAKANRETNDRERRNDQLQQQLKERDVLLEDMQAQLSALKMVLQNMQDQNDSAPQSSEQRSNNSATIGQVLEATGPKSISLAANSVYRPVVRHDLTNFNEFLAMIPPPPPSPRTSVISTAVDSSITSGRASPVQLGQSESSTASPSGNSTLTSNGSTNVTTLASRFQSITNSNNNTTPGLKDFKFFKKSLGDDIEPTLHLETAPGLSWLSRRNIMSSILDGSIVIEPIAAANEGYKLTVAAADDEFSAPEYLGLTESNSSASTNNPSSSSTGITPTNSSYAPLNHSQTSEYVASCNGHKIRTRLAGGTGSPVATRAPCAFCGEKRDYSLLYARLHNLRSGNKEKKGQDSSKDSARHAYHMSTDSVSSHVSSNHDERAGSSAADTSNDNDAASIHTVPGGFPNPTATTPTSTSVSTGYPLCYFCLNRIRAVCDYVSFMRSIRAGLWKIEDESGQMRAWEECMVLRERMYWARSGGYYLVSDLGQPVDPRVLSSGISADLQHMGSSRALSREASQDEQEQDTIMAEVEQGEESAPLSEPPRIVSTTPTDDESEGDTFEEAVSNAASAPLASHAEQADAEEVIEAVDASTEPVEAESLDEPAEPAEPAQP